VAYLDDLLASDERIVLIAHRHILFMVLHTVLYVLGAFVIWLAAFFAFDRLDTGQTAATIVLLALSIIPLGIATLRFLRWRKEQYAITTYRIIQVEGIINKRTFDSSLEKVNDVQMTQGMFGRLFGFGDISIMTGSDSGINNLWGIADPFVFKRTLQESKLNLSDNDRPLRFAATPREPAPTPVAAPQAQATQSGSDSTRLLAALVDLRDSGVISAAEYEERRNQLLQQQ
jgi:uncharacterized membrane protein YdbT with pleckstrin-like domain